MEKRAISRSVLPLALAATLLGGCTKTAQNNSANNGQNPQNAQQPQSNNANQPAQQAMNPQATPQPASGYAPQGAQPSAGYAPQAGSAAMAPAPRPAAPTDIPAGTHITVALGSTISSKTAQPGEPFNATVVSPVVYHGVTLVRAGAPASGVVVDAKSLGHFKGQAELALRLETIRSGGRTYSIHSSTVERAEKGKGKRTATLIGGGTGLGALIGGLAGGGKGAAIGALSGAGAGTAGSAFTGNKELVIPAETNLTFRVERSVPLE